MVDLTPNSSNPSTPSDGGVAPGYSEIHFDVEILRGELPTLSNGVTVSEDVLIWYHCDRHWYEGKVVFKEPERYQVEFRYTSGPRVRKWYQPSCGCIRPDTLETRLVLRAHGIKVISKPTAQS